jgi:hypothetical protein
MNIGNKERANPGGRVVLMIGDVVRWHIWHGAGLEALNISLVTASAASPKSWRRWRSSNARRDRWGPALARRSPVSPEGRRASPERRSIAGSCERDRDWPWPGHATRGQVAARDLCDRSVSQPPQCVGVERKPRAVPFRGLSIGPGRMAPPPRRRLHNRSA